jgi:hypothetical protein
MFLVPPGLRSGLTVAFRFLPTADAPIVAPFTSRSDDAFVLGRRARSADPRPNISRAPRRLD